MGASTAPTCVATSTRRTTISEEPQQHDEPALPDDAVEDVAPEGADQDVSGGHIYMKLDAVSSSGGDDTPTE